MDKALDTFEELRFFQHVGAAKAKLLERCGDF
jgi:hypothetical protein